MRAIQFWLWSTVCVYTSREDGRRETVFEAIVSCDGPASWERHSENDGERRNSREVCVCDMSEKLRLKIDVPRLVY